MHTGTYADHTAMVSSASPHLPDPCATQSKYKEMYVEAHSWVEQKLIYT